MKELKKNIDKILVDETFTHDINGSIVDKILSVITPTNIEWVGKCPDCHLGLSTGPSAITKKSKYITAENHCSTCDGTGKSIRQATIVEVLEKLPKMLDYIYGIEAPFKGAFGADYEVPDTLTVNNGQLRIKELIDVTEWVIKEKLLPPSERSIENFQRSLKDE